MANAQANQARERVISDLRTLAGDAEALLNATANGAGEKAKEIRARLAAAVDRARATCGDLQVRGVATVKATTRRVDESVRTHPYRSIAIALGVGALVGVLAGRKRTS